jgi:hypothetical protein
MVMVSFVPVFAIGALLNSLSEANDIPDEYTCESEGIIKAISYSSVRINNSPRFNAQVKYLGIEKEFGLLPEAFQFNFSIGDSVVIKYLPDDINQSGLDFDLSLAKKEEAQVQ